MDSSSPGPRLLESVVRTKKCMEEGRQPACVLFESAGADPPGLDRGLNLESGPPGYWCAEGTAALLGAGNIRPTPRRSTSSQSETWKKCCSPSSARREFFVNDNDTSTITRHTEMAATASAALALSATAFSEVEHVSNTQRLASTHAPTARRQAANRTPTIPLVTPSPAAPPEALDHRRKRCSPRQN